ncbi:hypothetical protein HDV00_010299 [Rhizophlyctis rosea]|nr:hypothetical protein HDV00_010299 [Rhizophlyctis rosea]
MRSTTGGRIRPLQVVKHARLVRTDTGNPDTLGTYFPCYSLDVAKPTFTKVKPRSLTLRDKSLDGWFGNVKKTVVAHASAVFQIFVRAPDTNDPTGAYTTTTATAFLVQTPNNRTLLCTTIHALIDNDGWGLGGSPMQDVEVWILKNEETRRMNLWNKFDEDAKDGVDLGERGFERVEVIVEALEARVSFLQKLHKEGRLEECFLDPEFGLYARPLLDLAFAIPPPWMLADIAEGNIAPFHVWDTQPQPGASFCAIAFQDDGEVFDAALYASTLQQPPASSYEYVYQERSCALGQISASGHLLTAKWSSTCGTSGCPLINSNGLVIGVNMASYYDRTEEVSTPCPLANNPDVSEQGTKQDPLAWIGPRIQETADPSQTMSRNRNIAVSTLHPGFLECLMAAETAVLEKYR